MRSKRVEQTTCARIRLAFLLCSHCFVEGLISMEMYSLCIGFVTRGILLVCNKDMNAMHRIAVGDGRSVGGIVIVWGFHK